LAQATAALVFGLAPLLWRDELIMAPFQPHF